MKILYIIALVSFAALAWAAVAITQHVRRKADEVKASSGTDAELTLALDNRIENILRPATMRPTIVPPVHAEPPVSSHTIEEEEEPSTEDDIQAEYEEDVDEERALRHPETSPSNEDSRWSPRP